MMKNKKEVYSPRQKAVLHVLSTYGPMTAQEIAEYVYCSVSQCWRLAKILKLSVARYEKYADRGGYTRVFGLPGKRSVAPPVFDVRAMYKRANAKRKNPNNFNFL